jgi:precorrin-6B methylase 2
MIDAIRSEAENTFNAFLKKHSDEIKDYTHVPIEETDLYSDFKDLSLDLTHFDDIYDTLLYSRLITRAIDESTSTLLDLGAGSSIPTLLALKKTQRSDLQTTAVDIDPEALRISQKNAAALGLSSSYTFVQNSIPLILNSKAYMNTNTLIVSNPPYIPTPQNVSDYHLIPVNGGWDGTEFLSELLTHEHPEGTILALLWGSLSNPIKMIKMIEEKYEVLHLEVVRIHFGNYTQIPTINSHLYNLRDKGHVIFDVDKRGETQIVVGSVLRCRGPSKTLS